jgi:hypothetical protein
LTNGATGLVFTSAAKEAGVLMENADGTRLEAPTGSPSGEGITDVEAEVGSDAEEEEVNDWYQLRTWAPLSREVVAEEGGGVDLERPFSLTNLGRDLGGS